MTPYLLVAFRFVFRSSRFVVMVAGKPATNSLLLTNQQTGTVQPGGSMDVSFSFHATSVGRWTHDLAVRNLGNKHDQVRWIDRRRRYGPFLFTRVCVTMHERSRFRRLERSDSATFLFGLLMMV